MKSEIKLALKVTSPVLFGYLALGIAFGLMVAEKGYPLWMTPLMSIFMFTGAGQYVAIGLFAAGTPLAAIIITEAFVSIRHIVYGLSLISKYADTGKWKPYLIFGLSDETYAICSSINIPDDMNKADVFGFISLFDQSYWIIGTVAGHLVGLILQNFTSISLQGIDFALTALFAVILTEQIMNSRDFVPPVIGGSCTIAAIILWKAGILPDSSSILLTALAAGVALIALLRHPSKKENTGTEK